MHRDEQLMLLDQKLEEAKSSIIAGLNEKAALTARQQRYETMLEQVQVRRSEVAQKILKFKSDESVQDEQLQEALKKLAKAQEEQEALASAQTECEEQLAFYEQEQRRLTKNLNDQQHEYHTASTMPGVSAQPGREV